MAAARRLSSVFIFAGQQPQFDFLRQEVRVTERDRAVLRFDEKREKAWIGFHYYSLTGFGFAATVSGSIKYPRTPVLNDLFPNCAQCISQFNHSKRASVLSVY
jgi:hypothetical protein